MKNVEINCRLTEYDSSDELSEELRNLLIKARMSVDKAYAPYSNFHVGAAVLLENGIVVTGNNQENASYPVGLCAERVAIFSAGANYPGIAVKAIAISAKSDKYQINKPVPPCGACRQGMAEYEHLYKKSIQIIMSGETGKIIVSESVKNLLPFQFNSDDMKNK